MTHATAIEPIGATHQGFQQPDVTVVCAGADNSTANKHLSTPSLVGKAKTSTKPRYRLPSVVIALLAVIGLGIFIRHFICRHGMPERNASTVAQTGTQGDLSPERYNQQIEHSERLGWQRPAVRTRMDEMGCNGGRNSV